VGFSNEEDLSLLMPDAEVGSSNHLSRLAVSTLSRRQPCRGTAGCANVLADDRSARRGATTYNTNLVDIVAA
jgi:hypothetical protein